MINAVKTLGSKYIITRIKRVMYNLDDVDVCSCVGAYKQYSDEYKNMDMETEE